MEFKTNLIKQCKEFIKENPESYGLELTVSQVKEVVKALEKQIPNKPIKMDIEHFIIDSCKTCEKTVSVENVSMKSERFKYCPSCGQAIQWED